MELPKTTGRGRGDFIVFIPSPAQSFDHTLGRLRREPQGRGKGVGELSVQVSAIEHTSHNVGPNVAVVSNELPSRFRAHRDRCFMGSNERRESFLGISTRASAEGLHRGARDHVIVLSVEFGICGREKTLGGWTVAVSCDALKRGDDDRGPWVL